MSYDKYEIGAMYTSWQWKDAMHELVKLDKCGTTCDNCTGHMLTFKGRTGKHCQAHMGKKFFTKVSSSNTRW